MFYVPFQLKAADGTAAAAPTAAGGEGNNKGSHDEVTRTSRITTQRLRRLRVWLGCVCVCVSCMCMYVRVCFLFFA